MVVTLLMERVDHQRLDCWDTMFMEETAVEAAHSVPTTQLVQTQEESKQFQMLSYVQYWMQHQEHQFGMASAVVQVAAQTKARRVEAVVVE